MYLLCKGPKDQDKTKGGPREKKTKRRLRLSFPFLSTTYIVECVSVCVCACVQQDLPRSSCPFRKRIESGLGDTSPVQARRRCDYVPLEKDSRRRSTLVPPPLGLWTRLLSSPIVLLLHVHIYNKRNMDPVPWDRGTVGTHVSTLIVLSVQYAYLDRQQNVYQVETKHTYIPCCWQCGQVSRGVWVGVWSGVSG